VALPAEAPVASGDFERGVTPVRLDGKVLESLVDGAGRSVVAPAAGA
jgi:hypothetical protein